MPYYPLPSLLFDLVAAFSEMLNGTSAQQHAANRLVVKLDKSDYKLDAKAGDLEYLLSETINALNGFDKGEPSQFRKDYPRQRNILDGKESSDINDFFRAVEAIQRTPHGSRMLAALSNLNQGVGNLSLGALMKSLQATHMVLPINRSVEMEAVFSKEADRFTMRYKLPLQLIPYTGEVELSSLENPKVDAMMESTLSIDTGTNIYDPGQVQHEIVIERRNPNIQWPLVGFTAHQQRERVNQSYILTQAVLALLAALRIYQAEETHSPVLCTIEEIPEGQDAAGWVNIKPPKPKL